MLHRHGAPTLLALLACAVLFGPERIPLDDFLHQEVRVSLCTRYREPHVIVETRTYERVRSAEGWTERQVSPPSGWHEQKDVRLYVTDKEPKE